MKLSYANDLFSKFAVENAAISPNFLLWKFCGRAHQWKYAVTPVKLRLTLILFYDV